jgi:opacity protein-like surface antigen
LKTIVGEEIADKPRPSDSTGNAFGRPTAAALVGQYVEFLRSSQRIEEWTAEAGKSDRARIGKLLADTLFTTGGALGFAIDRPSGLLRVEVEGRYRSPIETSYVDNDIPTTVRGTDLWSTLANVWRDVYLTERLGVYAGGGLGVGGARSNVTTTDDNGDTETTSSPLTSLAWQAGGGVTYLLSERVTLDLGYRYFALADTKNSAVVDGTTYYATSAFGASELLLSIRIYEPFRNWR